ncbi:hypothetical protein W97_08585 [Coniosporium apollinis CBS 100218]|uniref:J domain-containing protein n=1 Tax=Coniosporium apollinis (strain CBS 100218) TaxID=1168221 RepID=R7Z555_CONA1|nr:uncharacterized protein W97_08585 [Coniosporium apollinis CBS 100218]EON69325.1 hypothetical protein W97_08585 [Coniosporium apollinis CBS 100218]
MASPLPPDPYAALGVPRSADTPAIKSAYRRLVLKCHPDKVADETLKARAADEFHKIQQAYEILVDDDRRERYNSQVRLAELRREAMERSGSGSGPRVEVRTAAYDMRTPGGATYTAQGPARVVEERRPREYDDERYEQSRTSSRKYDGYEPSYGRRPAARTDREPIRVNTREKESDKTDRAERTRMRDREVRRERVRKTESASAYSDDSDGRANFENDYHRRSEDAARYQQDTRRGSERRSSRDDYYGNDVERKTSTAEDYIKRSKQGSYEDARPSPSRSTSSQPAYAYDVRSSRGSERPAYVRRSSAQPKPSSRRRSPERERRRDVIAEEEEYNARPTLEKSNSDPARVKAAVPPLRTRIQRSQTYQPDEHAQPSPPTFPDIRRAETMPMPVTATGTTSPNTSRRRGVTQPAQPSKLRSARETMHDSGYSSSSPGALDTAYPYAQEPPRPALDRSTSKTTYYTYPSGGVSVKPTSPHIQPQESGYRTVTREPGQPRNHSPDAISPRTREAERPPLSTARTVPAPAPAGVPTSRYATATAAPSPTAASRSASYAFAPETAPRPHMGRNTSYGKEYADGDPPVRSSGHREGHMLYGEQYSGFHSYGSGSRRDREREQPTSYAPEEVNWAQPIGERDVRYAARRRDEPAGVRPGAVRRSETFAY